MNATITLLAYWSIAIGLIGGGIFALAKGFQLVLAGRGKTMEECSIEFLGIKATVGSIGSLVMVTAFMWGWAAKLSLPNYKDAEVEIHALKLDLQQAETALAKLEIENSDRLAEVANLEERLTAARASLEQSQMAIVAELNESGILSLTHDIEEEMSNLQFDHGHPDAQLESGLDIQGLSRGPAGGGDGPGGNGDGPIGTWPIPAPDDVDDLTVSNPEIALIPDVELSTDVQDEARTNASINSTPSEDQP